MQLNFAECRDEHAVAIDAWVFLHIPNWGCSTVDVDVRMLHIRLPFRGYIPPLVTMNILWQIWAIIIADASRQYLLVWPHGPLLSTSEGQIDCDNISK